MIEAVDHPRHYTQGGIECIDAIRASMSPSGFADYCKGNIVKYLWRYRDKGGIEDLKKARWYDVPNCSHYGKLILGAQIKEGKHDNDDH